MKLFHATPTRNAQAILTEGLVPNRPGAGAGSGSITLVENADVAYSFISNLYGEHVTVFAVWVPDHILVSGDDDVDGEHATWHTIDPSMIEAVR